ncbi:MAG: aminodeoxychorismate synthase component I [Candidatus Cloacimonadota bacterium]|nr:MAG: aminodeoxychorismate synthase component I [Candidatus Cloacimonadota bacterium]PIE78703.1 MAG: aminodeoxychorismate synthase component I [Candidatus Delongbacteria bacterium]
MDWKDFEKVITEYLLQNEKFIFVIDFDCKKPFICKLEEAKSHNIFYNIRGKSNFDIERSKKFDKIKFKGVSKEIFAKSFNNVKKHIQNGDSYLLNLTFPSIINEKLDLFDIFINSYAPYKIYFKNIFTSFSPEPFIKIENNKVYTYPMKGTIDANISNAEEILLNNKKEEWEHNTVVDLLRNDMAIIGKNIELSNYRYIEKIRTTNGDILQTSSEIVGELKPNWKKYFGENLRKILPAGSISGAPKRKTIEIIKNSEITSRSYYTGVFGIYDGNFLESAVLIRYIEKNGDKLIFKSGGGITSHSKLEEEYNELLQKVYIPFV